MSHVFTRHTKIKPPVVAGGQGCYLFDQSGKQYLDGSGGAAVSCLGHGDADVIGAVKTQLDEIAFAHTGFFTSQPAEALADLLISKAPEGIDKVYFVSGGSEATEAAIKLARQYFVEKGEPARSRLIARKQSYHGNTIGALSAGGNEWRRAQFGPLLLDVSHIDPCYDYRLRHADETPEAYGLRAADALEAEILRVGPETVMAFMAEPVVGATSGAVPPAPGYFKRIREICDRYGVLLILDEVMCGMGRTGTLFASEQDDVRPDIIAIAKGLGGGYQPLGAMLCSGEIYRAIENGSGFFQHGHTYMGHPAACAAGLAVVNAILDRKLLPKVEEMGQLLRARLQERFGQHPNVGDIRGRGLFVGVELVQDRETKEPFAPSERIAAKIKSTTFVTGLICYPMSGTIDGRSGDHVLLAPPYIITPEQIGELVDKLAIGIGAATGV
ncbi:MAG: aspartate aminotransferase family protein [Hoeflea sp.]|uniref:aspartate aminotransferase family protein n=1 Tax=Hoeflea sp. TaxID=1940281 RepID=UPI003EF7C384